MKKISHYLLVFAFSFLFGIMIRQAVVDSNAVSIGQWIGAGIGIFAILWSFTLELGTQKRDTKEA